MSWQTGSPIMKLSLTEKGRLLWLPAIRVALVIIIIIPPNSCPDIISKTTRPIFTELSHINNIGMKMCKKHFLYLCPPMPPFKMAAKIF